MIVSLIYISTYTSHFTIFFFFNDTATTEIYTLSLHDALPILKMVLIALVGLAIGQAVVWYTGQFYALFFIQSILKVDLLTSNVLIAWSLILGTAGFVIFGALSDRIGRKPVILGGCLIAAITYFPLFGALTNVASPRLAQALETAKVQVTADPATCGSVFDPVGIRTFTAPCDVARVALARAAVKHEFVNGPAGQPARAVMNGKDVPLAPAVAANLTAFTHAGAGAAYLKPGDAS